MRNQLSLGPYFSHETPPPTKANPTPLGVRLEWATPTQAVALSLFGRDGAEQLKVRKVLCKASDIPVDVECSSADALDTPKGSYLPVEAVLCALYEQGRAVRPLFDVLRDFTAHIPFKAPSVTHPVTEAGLLRDDIECLGFYVLTAVRDEGNVLVDVCWRPTPQSAGFHAATILIKTDGTATWIEPVPGIALLLTKELERLSASTPRELFTPSGNKLISEVQ